MSGERIELAKEALILFLQSLPENSLFNVVSFGGSYKKMFESSLKYGEETLNQALSEIKTFKANMGGTDIFRPLTSVLKETTNEKYPRNIFLLTDGEVNEPAKVIEKN